MDKKSIRKHVLARRDALAETERAAKSEAICNRALLYAEANAPCQTPLCALYSAMGSEADLSAFARDAYARGWRICYPVMMEHPAGTPPIMEFFELGGEAHAHGLQHAADVPFLAHPLRRFRASDLEREGFRLVPAREIDVMAVPLVGFDGEGGRLGYGGGNYDRYLVKLRPDAVVFGVGFEEQRLDRVPLEPHDQPLPRIISA